MYGPSGAAFDIENPEPSRSLLRHAFLGEVGTPGLGQPPRGHTASMPNRDLVLESGLAVT